MSLPRGSRAGVGLVAAGHFLIDMSVGALPAFLPAFTALWALSDFKASMLLGASLLASSVVQPLFGMAADRWSTPVLLWGSVLVAAVGLGAAGLAGSYGVAFILIVGSGLGVAAYHPEAARVVTRISGERSTTGMAWFMVGGHMGFSAGPLVAAAFVPVLGPEATLVYLVPGLLIAGLLVVFSAHITAPEPPRTAAVRAVDDGDNHVPGLILLLGVTTTRTWAQWGFLALMPLFLQDSRGYSDREVGLVVFLFAVMGAVGTVAGARVAERIGGRRMLATTLPLVTPLLGGFILVGGAPGLVLLALGGAVLLASFSVTVVMGQDYLPGRIALAAGLMIGFGSIGSAPPGLAIMGALADGFGREAGLWMAASVPLLGGLAALALPGARGQGARL